MRKQEHPRWDRGSSRFDIRLMPKLKDMSMSCGIPISHIVTRYLAVAIALDEENGEGLTEFEKLELGLEATGKSLIPSSR